MTNLDTIIERCHSPEFKAVAEETADDLWGIINDTIVGAAHATTTTFGPAAEWERFYLPAMRHGVLRRLTTKCREGEEGWYEVWCNAVREEAGR